MDNDLAKYIDELRRREFNVDCVQMELIRDSDGRKYVGPGFIRQKPTRDFEIKIYAQGRMDPREIFGGFATSTAGVLYGKDDHFSLTATDGMKRIWKAERIVHPQCNSHSELEGFFVTATCQEVSVTVERWKKESSNWIELQSFESIEFPCTGQTEVVTKIGKTRSYRSGQLNVAEFDLRGYSFCFDDNNGLRILVSAGEKPIPPKLEWRVTEAITFALGMLPQWSVICRSEGKNEVTRLRSPAKRASKLYAKPPWKVEIVDPTGAIWRMFDLFLGYVMVDVTSSTHLLARHVIAVTPLDTSAPGQALSTVVAIESVLDDFYKDVGAPDKETKASVDDLMEHVESWTGDATIKKRALSPIGHMKSARADDRLRALEADGKVGSEEREAWKELRNTVAHGSWDAYELQELLDLTGKVKGLFNQLVFNLIGYTGKQTDYGTHGWPDIDYPPTKAPSDDASEKAKDAK